MATPPRNIRPLTSPLRGTWTIPGSKSITNRALPLAALAQGTSIIEGALDSDDTRHMRACLQQLGLRIEDAGPQRLLIEGGRARLRAPLTSLFVGNSGTTVRFLSALCCLVPGTTQLVGDAHMAKRPLVDLLEALRQLGVQVACATGCPPVLIHGGSLPGGAVRMRGDRSSQYFSALLMAGGLADAPLQITVEGTLVSRPYVRMTLRMIQDFGGYAQETKDGFRVSPCSSYRARSYVVEPDASAASYPLALAAASGGSVRIPGLRGDSLQGDVAFLDILEQMGANVERTPHHIAVLRGGSLRGVDVDMHHISDTVMTLAAIAPLCQGPTTIRNIANIRIKETDRLLATVTELRRLGQQVEYGEDWLRITPQPITPATIACYADHRMAMSFAVLGLCHAGITIQDPDCVAKTYPGFWDDAHAAALASGSQAPW